MSMRLPVGRARGPLPLLNVTTRRELTGSIERAGFAIVSEWKPHRSKALFIVAQNVGS